MKIFKKLFAVVLAILVVFVTFPTFTLPTKAASDNYYSKYGVTYNQLFSLYPQYLSCDSESLIVDDLIAKYRLVLSEYSATDGDVDAYLSATNNGISVFSDEFLKSLGITDDQKQTLRDSLSETLVKNILKIDSVASSVASEISDNFTVMKSGYDVSTAQGKSDFVTDIKKGKVK